MLDAVIKNALRYRLLTIVLAIAVMAYGSVTLSRLPIDVFPDLNRPRVTILTEAPGLAPEEVETLITFPLESVLNGATGVQAVRSSSGVGLSVITIEFGWGTDIYVDRQIVAEKIALALDRMPKGIRPQLAPISSIMGQIMHVGMTSDTGATPPIEVRTLADWVVRQRLLTIPGVAQVVTMGGGRKQFQVLVDPSLLLRYDISLAEVEAAVQASNSNATGGYLNQGGNELLVRSLGRIQSLDDLTSVVIKATGDRPVVLGQVARVAEAAQVKRGDAAVNGLPAVMLVISKQPGADTRRLTENITRALDELRPSLPADIRVNPEIYQQKTFIDLSIRNVIEALRDGGVLVVVVLFLFLLNFRTTFITLTAIPLSIVITGLVFKWLGMSINTMTLGGPGRDDRRARRRRDRRRRKHFPPPPRERPPGGAEIGARGGVRGEQRGPPFHRLQHDPRRPRVRAAVRPGGDGREALHSPGHRLHRLHPGLAPGLLDRHPRALFLAPAGGEVDGS